MGEIVTNVDFQDQNEALYVVRRIKLRIRREQKQAVLQHFHFNGFPDLSVIAEDEPHLFLAIGEVS